MAAGETMGELVFERENKKIFANEIFHIKVILYDKCGVKLNRGEDYAQFTASFFMGETLTSSCTQQGAIFPVAEEDEPDYGEYLIPVMCTTSGQYNAKIKYGETDIKNNPFPFQIYAGALFRMEIVDPAFTEVSEWW